MHKAITIHEKITDKFVSQSMHINILYSYPIASSYFTANLERSITVYVPCGDIQNNFLNSW